MEGVTIAPNSRASSRREYEASDLVPAPWLRMQPADRFIVYNPAIVRYRGRLLMAYRVDFGREKPFRVACAICELDERLDVVPDSIVALSDTIAGGTDNHYDPRFLVFRDRLYVHYNNDWNTVPNQVSLVELDADSLAARSPARTLNLEGPRQPCEKNWMLFEHDDDLFAVYQIVPHIVLHVDVNSIGAIGCRPIYRAEWDIDAYLQRYGVPRGGAPPVCCGDHYVSVFHSRSVSLDFAGAMAVTIRTRRHRLELLTRAMRWIRENFAPVRYYAGVYTFAASPPFAPIELAPHPLLRPEQEAPRRRPTAGHMAPRRVVYPCGLVRMEAERWLLSYGLHDERCILRFIAGANMEIGAKESAPRQVR